MQSRRDAIGGVAVGWKRARRWARHRRLFLSGIGLNWKSGFLPARETGHDVGYLGYTHVLQSFHGQTCPSTSGSE